MAEDLPATPTTAYGPSVLEAAPSSPAPAEIVVSASPTHPVDGPSIEIGTEGAAVNLPCPIDKIGPVRLSCGAGVSPFDLQAFARVRGTLDLGDGWRGVAELNGSAGADFQVNAGAVLGIATPPIKALQGSSILVGVNPTNGTPSVRLSRSF